MLLGPIGSIGFDPTPPHRRWEELTIHSTKHLPNPATSSGCMNNPSVTTTSGTPHSTWNAGISATLRSIKGSDCTKRTVHQFAAVYASIRTSQFLKQLTQYGSRFCTNFNESHATSCSSSRESRPFVRRSARECHSRVHARTSPQDTPTHTPRRLTPRRKYRRLLQAVGTC